MVARKKEYEYKKIAACKIIRIVCTKVQSKIKLHATPFSLSHAEKPWQSRQTTTGFSQRYIWSFHFFLRYFI
jgi:hypothetical protein